MRTTLDIDDDVLNAAKELATSQRTSAGKIISDLARKALTGVVPVDQQYRNGVPLFPRHGKVITPEFIKMLDEQSE